MARNKLFIYPLDLGTLIGIDKAIFTHLRNEGVKIDVPCIGWLILGGEKKVLVDTGPCDPAWASRFHRPIKKEPSQEINGALSQVGLSPKDIDVIIFTHLHWDHCFNLEQFSASTFLVQQEELRYAVTPLPADRKAYEAYIPGIQPPWMSVFGKIIPLNGDQQVLPGIQVIHLPGHTPGSQGVAVDTHEGTWLIAGDNVPLYENWRGDNYLDHIPSGVYQNLYDMDASLKKMDAFGERVLPSHDKEILEHKRYPLADPPK